MTASRRIIDHADLLVTDLPGNVALYEEALAPLGLRLLVRSATSASFGIHGADDFGLNQVAAGDVPTTGAHLAFVAPDRAAVEAFYQAALAHGATSKHPPANHPEYHAGYYAAFIYDLQANNIEAVVHERDGD